MEVGTQDCLCLLGKMLFISLPETAGDMAGMVMQATAYAGVVAKQMESGNLLISRMLTSSL